MPRAPVLPSLANAAERSPVFAGGTGPPEADGYAERLTKYVPGEVIPFFLAFASVEGIADGQLIAALVIAELVALVWAIDRNSKLEEDLRRPHTLVAFWSVIAFFAWAAGTSPATQDLLGWPALTCALILAATALLLPKLDDVIVGWIVRKRSRD